MEWLTEKKGFFPFLFHEHFYPDQNPNQKNVARIQDIVKFVECFFSKFPLIKYVYISGK